MTVRAKFQCTSVTPNNAEKPEDKGSSIHLSPVTSGSKENEDFYRWTPGGEIFLSTVNEAAAASFIPGKEYYVDFTPAPEPEKGE